MAQNDRDLHRLEKLFSSGKWYTARQIAQQMRCSRPVAYARVKTLRERGFKLVEQKVREGLAGPLSVAYKKKA